jgi:hypothetical protein
MEATQDINNKSRATPTFCPFARPIFFLSGDDFWLRLENLLSLGLASSFDSLPIGRRGKAEWEANKKWLLDQRLGLFFRIQVNKRTFFSLDEVLA